VLWALQRRALAAVREEVLAGGPGAAARDVTARITAAPAPRRRRGVDAASRRAVPTSPRRPRRTT